ncbi:G-type lectin S-receptor-like serine/threonine-protein kinase At1g11300 [Chenopodium quinoa]|uniref:G-type lectin S-receptor-like serine/threonine-protein kinase At1g11300 n=1 Tax=Chenopodium quinoa TaxID=63459 RepID=UPI000B782EF6|nr:G-type lectin S-receptor-like serine/threonine-protein kinase At1g11300 [Chenopodium quinoa]
MNNIYTFLVCISWFLFVFFAAATTNYTRISNITTTQFLRDPEALASSNGNFMVGFFSPTNSTNRYVGIWYSNKQDSESGISEVVWIANRDNPLINSSDGVFGISENGNLQVLDGQNKSIWSTNISQGHQANNSVAQLLDTGNLVLISNVSGETIWQSFDHLTNSVLPPVTVTLDMHTNGSSLLRSWKSASDPSSGRFSFVSLPRNLPEFFIMDGYNPCWRSGPWNGNLFLGIPYMHSEVSNGFQINNKIQGKLEVSYSVANLSLLERLVLNYDGRLFQEYWRDSSGKREVYWNSSESECDVYGKCGVFGSCDPKNSPICSCLKGFEPNNKDEWNKGNWTSGCFRRTPLQCGTLEGKSDKFLRLEHMKVPDYAYWLSSGGQDGCERKCLQNCSCIAFAYYTGIGCMMWNASLVDIQQYSAEGAALFIRLAHSELDDERLITEGAVLLIV